MGNTGYIKLSKVREIEKFHASVGNYVSMDDIDEIEVVNIPEYKKVVFVSIDRPEFWTKYHCGRTDDVY